MVVFLHRRRGKVRRYSSFFLLSDCPICADSHGVLCRWQFDKQSWWDLRKNHAGTCPCKKSLFLGEFLLMLSQNQAEIAFLLGVLFATMLKNIRTWSLPPVKARAYLVNASDTFWYRIRQLECQVCACATLATKPFVAHVDSAHAHSHQSQSLDLM